MEVDNNLCFQAPDFFLKTDIIFKFLLLYKPYYYFSSEKLYYLNEHSEGTQSLKFIS